MTNSRPRRRTSLQFSQIRLTLARTFMVHPSLAPTGDPSAGAPASVWWPKEKLFFSSGAPGRQEELALSRRAAPGDGSAVLSTESRAVRTQYAVPGAAGLLSARAATTGLPEAGACSGAAGPTAAGAGSGGGSSSVTA